MPPRSDAPTFVAAVALACAALAHAAGWGALVGAFSGGAGSKVNGLWMLSGAGLALILNGLAVGLGVSALLLRAGKRAPYSLALAVGAVALGGVGLIGVAVLAALGLLVIAPGVR